MHHDGRLSSLTTASVNTDVVTPQRHRDVSFRFPGASGLVSRTRWGCWARTRHRCSTSSFRPSDQSSARCGSPDVHETVQPLQVLRTSTATSCRAARSWTHLRSRGRANQPASLRDFDAPHGDPTDVCCAQPGKPGAVVQSPSSTRRRPARIWARCSHWPSARSPLQGVFCANLCAPPTASTTLRNPQLCFFRRTSTRYSRGVTGGRQRGVGRDYPVGGSDASVIVEAGVWDAREERASQAIHPTMVSHFKGCQQSHEESTNS